MTFLYKISILVLCFYIKVTKKQVKIFIISEVIEKELDPPFLDNMTKKDLCTRLDFDNHCLYTI